MSSPMGARTSLQILHSSFLIYSFLLCLVYFFKFTIASANALPIWAKIFALPLRDSLSLGEKNFLHGKVKLLLVCFAYTLNA